MNKHNKINQAIKDFIFIISGIFSAGFGLKGFLLPNHFIDGGVTGMSLLIKELTNIPLPILIIVVNTPFILLGYFQLGKKFAIKSILAIIGLAIVLLTIKYPIITSDKLLVSVFGGFFLGTGIGMAVRGSSVLDGTEVLAIYLSKRFGVTIGDIILFLNVLIFSVAAYFLSIEVALYSLLSYLSASKTMDFFIEGVEQYIGVTIISHHSEEIRSMLTKQMERGVTIYNGNRGFGENRKELEKLDILFTTITRLEISRLKRKINDIDENAFIVMNNIKDIKGGVIKKRPFNH
jgi:uncharacterized membrane-anchored protein YitT (DUF2179 family)